jgi:hypothetical protein
MQNKTKTDLLFFLLSSISLWRAFTTYLECSFRCSPDASIISVSNEHFQEVYISWFRGKLRKCSTAEIASSGSGSDDG